jgi:apolipoprotein N-acyltransferase
MRNVQQLNFRTPGKIATILTIMVSGLCWYFGNGLNGEYWFLVWLAPIPVLVFSFNAATKPALLVSFIAYLVGRLSWFSYLVKVATLLPAIIFTLALPLVFILIIFLTRRAFLKTNTWYSVFAFPVFFTAFECILFTFSPNGTAGSIAYSQSNFLPLIQIASITGVLGVTFLATLIPSLIASGWYFRTNRAITWSLIITGVIIISSVFLFGATRMRHSTSDSISAGLVVLDEKKT